MSSLIFSGVPSTVAWVHWMLNASSWTSFWTRLMRILTWVMLSVWLSPSAAWSTSTSCVRRRSPVGVPLRTRSVPAPALGDFLPASLEEGIPSPQMPAGIYWCVVFLNLWTIWYRFSVTRPEVVVWLLLHWTRQQLQSQGLQQTSACRSRSLILLNYSRLWPHLHQRQG